MNNTQNLVYIYDGTIEGFLCCVYESYVRKETPVSISPSQDQIRLFEQTDWIKTDMDHAHKVYASIGRKIGPEAQDYVKDAFLTRLQDKEMHIYRFIAKGYKIGRPILSHLTDETVDTLSKAILHLKREAHLLMGFVRFTLYDDVMVACISPKNQVLPLLSEHFSNRYPDETFMIYDRTHQMALVHKPEGMVLTAIDDLTLPPIDSSEKAYHALWKCFQKTIAIPERENPVCQRNMMPKRYWRNMTEFEL